MITGTGVELRGRKTADDHRRKEQPVYSLWDTVFTNLDAMDVFEEEVKMIKMMGFDGKSLVRTRDQIDVVHKVIYPDPEGKSSSLEKVVKEIDEKKAQGIGVFTVDGKMIDIAFYDGAKRTIALAKASGVYEGIYKMINAVGKRNPGRVIKGQSVRRHSKGAYAYDNYEYTRAAPKAHTMMDPKGSKIVEASR